MRFYDIKVFDKTGVTLLREWTSYVSGLNDPGAQNVEFDLPVAAFATPLDGSFIRIWGIGLNDLGQGSNLNPTRTASGDYDYKIIQVFGGMSKGLPLANPAQQGLLVQGKVLQAFGNWQGVNMTLDIIIGAGQPAKPGPTNLSFTWPRGTRLADMITTTLTNAFPGYKTSVAISQNLVLQTDEPGFYGSLPQFAQYVKEVSLHLISGPAPASGTYAGVDISLRGTTFYVVDGTSQTAPKMISFNDLVGQPVWIGPNQLHIEVVQRGDLNINDYIQLPPGAGSLVQTTAASLSQFKDRSILQGIGRISLLRHIGNFRSPDSGLWSTSIDAYFTAMTSASSAAAQSSTGKLQ